MRKHNALISFLQGRFMNHPLHPIAVHLPVGLWITSLFCDILFMMEGTPVFAAVSYYCILFGLVGVVLAAPTGLADYLETPEGTEPRRIATAHLSLNLFVTLLFIIDFFARHGLESGVPSGVTRGEILLSTVAVALLAVSGYLGGILVYEHGIGHRARLRARKGPPEIRRAA
jgi:uncharacterized membrane protein